MTFESDIMKRIVYTLLVSMAAASCAAPSAETPMPEEAALVCVDTRAVASDNVQMLAFYPDGKLAAYASSGDGTAAMRLRTGGPYTLLTLADCPDVSGTQYATLPAVEAVQIPLVAVSSSFPSVSRIPVSSLGKDGLSILPALSRQVARVRICRITNAMPAALGRLEIESVYLSNVVASCNLAGEGSGWLNPMGRLSDAPGPTYCAVNRELMHGSSLELGTALYCYPNPTVDDVCGYAPQMTPRCTRLVVAARIGAQLRYYPVTISCPEANTSYDISITITNLGSNDPDLPVTTEVMRAVATMSEWAFGEQINIYF